MDSQRFDRIASSFAETRTRRSALRALAAVALGAGGLAILGGAEGDANKRHKKKKGGKGGGGNGGGGGGRNDRCGGPVGICNADPTPCGTTAIGNVCGCERAVEGNNVCINGDDDVCDYAVECTSTDGDEATSCKNLRGFHWFCQEAKKSSSGQFCGCGFGTTTGRVCVPECDNTNPY
jgi:hypothetical protein